MYLFEKCHDEFKRFMEFIFIIMIIAIAIWCLNGGRNDWGVVHHVVIYMTFSCLACILLAGFIVVMAFCDLMKWLLK